MSTEIFDFADTVLRKFAFLCENGFSVTERNDSRVGYSSDKYKVYIYHGRRSREIGLEFLPLAPAPFGAASLKTLVAVFDREAADNFPDQVQVCNRETVEERIEFLAHTFRHYVKFEALQAADFWDKVVSEGNDQFRRRYPTITTGELHRRFISMWENKRYADLVRIFSVLEGDLSPEEKKMLNHAKNEVASSH